MKPAGNAIFRKTKLFRRLSCTIGDSTVRAVMHVNIYQNQYQSSS